MGAGRTREQLVLRPQLEPLVAVRVLRTGAGREFTFGESDADGVGGNGVARVERGVVDHNVNGYIGACLHVEQTNSTCRANKQLLPVARSVGE